MCMNDTIELAIMKRAEEIKYYIKEGIPQERAISMVRETSTLGPDSWEKVLEQVQLISP